MCCNSASYHEGLTRKIRSDIPAGHSFLHLQVGSGHGEELARGAGPLVGLIHQYLKYQSTWGASNRPSPVDGTDVAGGGGGAII